MSDTILRRIKEKRRAMSQKARTALWAKAEDAWRGEIERLREELKQSIDRETMTYFRMKRMEAALRKIANYHPSVTHGWANDVRHIARRELGEDQ